MKLSLLPHCIVGIIVETIEGELLTGLSVTSLKKTVVFSKTLLTFRSQMNSFTMNVARGA